MSVDGRIIELRKQGYGYKTIAKQLGLKRDDVRYICQKNGLVGVMSRNNTESLDEREKNLRMFLKTSSLVSHITRDSKMLIVTSSTNVESAELFKRKMHNV